MGRIDIEPWEPEETIGKLWHAYASRLDAPGVHDGARVDLSEVAGRLAVLFRGLGGDPAVEIKAVSEERSGTACHGCVGWAPTRNACRAPPSTGRACACPKASPFSPRARPMARSTSGSAPVPRLPRPRAA